MTPKFVFGKEKNDWIKRPLLSNIEKILDYRGRTPKKLGLSWSDTGFLALSALNVKNGYIDFNADANYGDQEFYIDGWEIIIFIKGKLFLLLKHQWEMLHRFLMMLCIF